MTKLTSFRLDDNLSNKLEALAISMDRPKTWLIEQAVRHYVDEQAWQVQAIQEAVNEVDSGKAVLIPHEEVMSRFEQKLVTMLKP